MLGEDVNPDVPGVEGILNDLLRGDAPIETSFEDAATEVPFLDRFDPDIVTPLTVLPRNDRGELLWQPGLYTLPAESYCLHAGTYAPTRGDGYLYAPLRGSRAEIVGNILRRSVDRPDIPQQDIQILLWGILAQTELSQMSPNIQQAAAALLSEEEIDDLDGSALDVISQLALQEAIAHLPAPVQQVLQAEARLRSLFAQGNAVYSDLERVAVLFGEPPDTGEREIPGGRWSYHRNGYFIRYRPSGYSLTQIDVSVPDVVTVERDDRDRIVAIADTQGNRIEAEYDDAIAPLSVSGNSNLQGYAFRSIRVVRRTVLPPELAFDLTATWNDVGWTFVGVPSGNGRVSASGRFADAQQRYDRGAAYLDELDTLDDAIDPDGDIDDVLDLAHYTDALQQVLQGNRDVAWADDGIDLARRAWQYAVCRRAGACQTSPSQATIAPVLVASSDLESNRDAIARRRQRDRSASNTVDLGVAVPANTSQQRLAQSTRPNEDEAKKKACETVQKDIASQESILRAFQNERLLRLAQQLGKDGYAYAGAVNNLIKKMFDAGGWDNLPPNAINDTLFPQPGETGSAAEAGLEAPMGTNSLTCEISPGQLSEYIRTYGGETAGSVIYNANMAHEQFHRNTCQAQIRQSGGRGYRKFWG
ncbi:hypothetical protein CKA32_006687 [Geitlerinema sp. FC II]|nr:hypothetical protein CKA32_006687 [Geitlerinema sp. FC II]